eukprot:15443584-Alexandrium_andersonii.AAC.1
MSLRAKPRRRAERPSPGPGISNRWRLGLAVGGLQVWVESRPWRGPFGPTAECRPQTRPSWQRRPT